MPILGEVSREPPAIWVSHRRYDARGSDGQGTQRFATIRQSRRTDGLGCSKQQHEQHAEKRLDVQIAPESDEGHCPHEGSGGSAAPGVLDQQGAGSRAGKRRKMRTGDCPGFEHEPPEHE